MSIIKKILYFKQRLNNYIEERYRNHYLGEIKPKVKNEDFGTLKLNTPNKVSLFISELLESDKPCMISRFGSVELTSAIYYRRGGHPFWRLRKIFPFWVPLYVNNAMINNAGFFPSKKKYLCDFSDLIFESVKYVDLLGSWLENELIIKSMTKYEKCCLWYLEPYWSDIPWTRCLKGKKVLVIHPFAETIKEQYKKRVLLFDNPDVLPEFAKLTVIKSVQSIGGKSNGFKNWFEALQYMAKQIDSTDYDVALIGCGAYGMPLAAHCKKQGKKAIHLGGALQLLFGIKGKRWETKEYGSSLNLNYSKIINNPYWVRAKASERPDSANKVEEACYW